jgi:hypothetical protein
MVHPLFGFVAVTVYVFGMLTELLAEFTPLLHVYVTPAVVDVASNVVLATTQVNNTSVPAFTFGVALSTITTTASLAVHPLDGSVAVTV